MWLASYDRLTIFGCVKVTADGNRHQLPLRADAECYEGIKHWSNERLNHATTETTCTWPGPLSRQILINVLRAPVLLRQAFMFAFNLKSIFWGTMLRRAKVYNGTKVLSLLFPVSPYVKFSRTTYVHVHGYIVSTRYVANGTPIIMYPYTIDHYHYYRTITGELKL